MTESNSRAFQVLNIEEMLPLLASSYMAGRLVPFIGAGMSRRKLAGWEGFVQNLEKEVAIQSPELSGHIEVRAQRAIAALRNGGCKRLPFFESRSGRVARRGLYRIGGRA